MSLLNRDWKTVDPEALEGWEALCWWVDHLAEESAALEVPARWARTAQRIALEWLYALAPGAMSSLTEAERAAGFSDTLEDRVQGAVATLMEHLKAKSWRPERAGTENELRNYVRKKLRFVDIDERRKWRSRTPDYKALEDRAKARGEDASVSLTDGPAADVSAAPVDLDELPGAEGSGTVEALLEDTDALVALITSLVIEPCAADQQRKDARANLARDLAFMLDLYVGRASLEALAEAVLREEGKDADSKSERRRVLNLINKRNSRARDALMAWLPFWVAAAPPGEEDRRAAMAKVVPDMFRVRAPSGTDEPEDP